MSAGVVPVLIVPVLNRPELLYRMVESIDYPVERLVVIDNGRVVNRHRLDDALQDCPGRVGERFVLTMPTNLGVPVSWNLGIKSSPFTPWWLIVNFDTVFPAGSLERFAAESSANLLTLAQASPPWSCFSVGEGVVTRVGLFDEAFVPAYYEDKDYERRCEALGAPVVHSSIPVHHDNSSTIAGGYGPQSDHTLPFNRAYHEDKIARADLGEGGWSLARRRGLSWD